MRRSSTNVSCVEWALVWKGYSEDTRQDVIHCLSAVPVVDSLQQRPLWRSTARQPRIHSYLKQGNYIDLVQ